jgi:hypothetical protein
MACILEIHFLLISKYNQRPLGRNEFQSGSFGMAANPEGLEIANW